MAEAKKEARSRAEKGAPGVGQGPYDRGRKSRPTLPRRKGSWPSGRRRLQNERSRMYAVKAIKKPDWTTAEITPWAGGFRAGRRRGTDRRTGESVWRVGAEICGRKGGSHFLSPREESPRQGDGGRAGGIRHRDSRRQAVCGKNQTVRRTTTWQSMRPAVTSIRKAPPQGQFYRGVRWG